LKIAKPRPFPPHLRPTTKSDSVQDVLRRPQSFQFLLLLPAILAVTTHRRIRLRIGAGQEPHNKRRSNVEQRRQCEILDLENKRVSFFPSPSTTATAHWTAFVLLTLAFALSLDELDALLPPTFAQYPLTTNLQKLLRNLHPQPVDVALVKRADLPLILYGKVHRGMEYDEQDVH
jgi:hypothetical protein